MSLADYLENLQTDAQELAKFLKDPMAHTKANGIALGAKLQDVSEEIRREMITWFQRGLQSSPCESPSGNGT